ncbi:MAG: helix-turn-helix domain-containing protein [Clostridia bacterium]|nr:helix-turn-helix domain-containing protein [Clostridia bacterium]
MEKLGNKIFQLRKARGLSQEELAEALNVSRQSVSKWETDQSVPDYDNITAMCAFFNVSIDGFTGNAAEQAAAAVQPAAEAVAENKPDNKRLWKKIVLATFVWFFAALGFFTCISVAMISIIEGGSDPQYLTMVLPILCVSYAGLFGIVFAIVAVFYKKFKKPRV